MTDLPNRLLPRPAAPTARFTPPGNAVLPAVDSPCGGQEDIDVLSDVLRCVRLTASMFFLVEATAPWRTNAPAARSFTRLVLPADQHLVSYHVVTEGTCWSGIRGQAAQPMEAGDILVVPHGHPYYLANPRSAEPGASEAEAVEFFRQMVAGELPQVVTEGGPGSQRTRFICGFLGCDARPFNPILAALPPVLYLRRTMQADGPMRHLIALAQAELKARRPGGREVLLRLSELMFIAAIRCHAQQLAREASPSHADLQAVLPSDLHDGTHTGAHPDLSPTATGWLAGLHDPLVGRVLALLHSRPAHAWTLQALALEAGASRSVLAARFTRVVGQPPIRYLAAWRMQLATRMLAEQAEKVRTVAEAVGYDSEAAFSRAFTRLVGSNPVAWRRRTGQAPSVASRPAAHAHGPGDVRRLMEPR